AIFSPKLDENAKTHHKIHHSKPHALEIKNRAMYIITNLLNIFPPHIHENQFLNALISFLIEFHDQELIECGSFNSIEEMTAHQLIEELDSAILLKSHPQLKVLIEFLADRIIVLGTTMIFGLQQTTDLSEIYLLMESELSDSEFMSTHPSNMNLIKAIETVMLITGVCDKNPAALFTVVERQQRDRHLETFSLLKKVLQHSSLLEQFFHSHYFVPYYTKEGASLALNIQTFLITLPPHLGMSAELVGYSKAQSIRSLIEFIALCRNTYSYRNQKDFQVWYSRAFSILNIASLIDDLLFKNIEGEINFSLSQKSGLKFAQKQLISKGYLNPIAEAHSFIEVTVPEKDAQNLKGMRLFYQHLNHFEKLQLLEEVALALILQAGALYPQQPIHKYASQLDSIPEGAILESKPLTLYGIKSPLFFAAAAARNRSPISSSENYPSSQKQIIQHGNEFITMTL
ncbi:MAG: hypothetical protein PSV35_07085, partial [bacterium]|nr:hypothetical protein [bacterium]